jgi:hypothetical protein
MVLACDHAPSCIVDGDLDALIELTLGVWDPNKW